ncbi:hypothetical protein PFY01_01415 [Brevundimonas vesicularis]|uniref:DUF6615 family protein n=1 Tax=Brevundimonas vesicularis TaxID=41276 RepID=UPI0022EC91A0|nr:DUF6615 family protein [Brevundimonas vesicularis]WBT06367.1 hypothetical protein PFY01_01415 [Brevundimonas vesicularis]
MNPFNPSALCELADWFPMQVAHEIEGARREGHQFRETTWTDRFILEVRRLRDPRIFVKTSHEAMTGADMDWWFIASDGSRHLRLSVQAKILHYMTKNSELWAYPELRHPNGAHGKQSRQLIRHARSEQKAGRATYPLYLFYNPVSTSHPWPLFYQSPGITLADGFWIAAHLQAHRSGASIPIAPTRYSQLRDQMFGLPMVFCHSRDVPGPDDVAEAINDANDMIWAGREARKRPRARPSPEDGTPNHIWTLVQKMKHGDVDTGDDDDRGKTGLWPRNTVVFVASD